MADPTIEAVLHTYDVLDRLIQQTTGLGTVEYGYDALGRRTSMRVTGQAPVAYSYDANSRLTQITQGAQLVDFAYDTLDRRVLLTLPNGVATEYSYRFVIHDLGAAGKIGVRLK